MKVERDLLFCLELDVSQIVFISVDREEKYSALF